MRNFDDLSEVLMEQQQKIEIINKINILLLFGFKDIGQPINSDHDNE